MEKMLLREKEVSPNSNVLLNLLGDVFIPYEELEEKLVAKDLIYIWNYYNDGKAWLCKVQFKKKTVFWLSIWDGFFKLTLAHINFLGTKRKVYKF